MDPALTSDAGPGTVRDNVPMGVRSSCPDLPFISADTIGTSKRSVHYCSRCAGKLFSAMAGWRLGVWEY